MFWSRINTDKDRSRPRPLNRAFVTNASMLATDVEDARARSLAIAALMSFCKFLIYQISRRAVKGLSAIDETASNHRAFNIWFRDPAGFSVRFLAICLTRLCARSLRLV